MFREALLESSPAMCRRNAWPMATAFTLEMIIASVLVLAPLISTGILPLSTRVAYPVAPAQYVPESAPQTSAPSSGGSGPTFQRPQVISIAPNGRQLIDWNLNEVSFQGPSDPWQPSPDIGPKSGLPSSLFSTVQPVQAKPPKRPVISNLSEAMILTKIIPEYPSIAKLAGVQGDVKLHAVIAKDGTIQSLTVTSGPDMLREAALKAVQQWRYRPYILNGQPVEVETVITVSFKRS
jgi:periplasmic protein TonB